MVRLLRNAAKLYIEGQLQTRKWQDQSGQDRYSTEIVLQGFNGVLTMLDGKGAGDREEPSQEAQEGRERASSNGGGRAFDDEIPF
mgnify:CR=1 FL=1